MKSERNGINASVKAVQVVSNAWRLAVGGYIFADAPNVVTSAAVITQQVNTRRSITQLLVTPLSRVSSRGSAGFTITVQRISLAVRLFQILNRIR